jgi:flavin reductase (DIM6/NTAB) family NADH-FMN oxidoreductase RutF
MTNERHINRSGGGIVSRSGARAAARTDDHSELDAFKRAWRRRWASGIAIATTTSADGSFRGITLTAVMSVSLDPPVIALALTVDGAFLEILRNAGRCALHILDRDQDFIAERFAGRAPVPDGAFSGVPHTMVDGLPVLDRSLAWAIGDVERIDTHGDHALVLVRIQAGSIGGDTDDPLLSYEGRYRGLEAS